MPWFSGIKKGRGVRVLGVFGGWKMGLEPTTYGTTIRRSNQLSYIHHVRKGLSPNCGAKLRSFFESCKFL